MRQQQASAKACTRLCEPGRVTPCKTSVKKKKKDVGDAACQYATNQGVATRRYIKNNNKSRKVRCLPFPTSEDGDTNTITITTTSNNHRHHKHQQPKCNTPSFLTSENDSNNNINQQHTQCKLSHVRALYACRRGNLLQVLLVADAVHATGRAPSGVVVRPRRVHHRRRSLDRTRVTVLEKTFLLIIHDDGVGMRMIRFLYRSEQVVAQGDRVLMQRQERLPMITIGNVNNQRLYMHPKKKTPGREDITTA